MCMSLGGVMRILISDTDDTLIPSLLTAKYRFGFDIDLNAKSLYNTFKDEDEYFKYTSVVNDVRLHCLNSLGHVIKDVIDDIVNEFDVVIAVTALTMNNEFRHVFNAFFEDKPVMMFDNCPKERRLGLVKILQKKIDYEITLFDDSDDTLTTALEELNGIHIVKSKWSWNKHIDIEHKIDWWSLLKNQF